MGAYQPDLGARGRKGRAGTKINIAVIILLTAVFSAVAAGSCGCRSGKETDELTKIQELIESFRSGVEFDGDVEPYVTGGKPDMEAVGRFRTALEREDEPVREQVCRLLGALGKRVDPLYEKGGGMIRDRTIVGILVNDGLSRKGPARDICLDLLQYAVPGHVLKDFGRQMADNLKMYPDATLLLVIAKAKAPEAKDAVDSLMKIPGWAGETETRIAAAALGDREIERSFIERFRAAQEPAEKAELAKLLGLIGTESALREVAAAMRSDMIIEMSGVSSRSIRIYFIEALSYNFPEETFLYDNAVNSDEDYAKVEKFCEERFGVKWKKERPPFLWIQGYPTEPQPDITP